MTLTVKDIRDRLRVLDEVTVLELLGLTTDDLVDRYEDIIQDRADWLEQQLEEETFFAGEGSDEEID